MNPRPQGPQASAWRAPRVLAFAAFALVLIGCQSDADSESASPSRWWYVEDAASEGDMAFRTAMVMSTEGWNGAESKAASISVFSDLYANGGLLLQISMTGRATRPRCSMQGCYLYARRPGGVWQVLRAVPTGESRQFLDVINPWSLQDLVEGAEVLEIDVPVQPSGSCVYTLPVAGYRPDLHQPKGVASLNGDGTPRSRLAMSPEDQKALDGPPSADTAWPRCTGRTA